MRDKSTTKKFYIDKLGFKLVGDTDFDGYLMVEKDSVEIHFFEFKQINPKENYGQIYLRVESIDSVYNNLLANNVEIHPAGHLQIKPWGQKEFALLDPDNNLLTFGEHVVHK